MSNVVPPGYETFYEARRRALELGHNNGDKFLGLLLKGQ